MSAPTPGCSDGCREALERLEAFLDGELPHERIEEITAHLSDCGPCTDRAGFEEQLRTLVRQGCMEEAPADLMERVRQRLAEDRAG